MKRLLTIGLVVIILGVLAWTMVYLYKKSQEKPINYTTQTPQYTNIVQKTLATGTVIPRQSIDIKPAISGIIKTLYVQAGQKVEIGDLIAKIQIIPDMVNLSNAQDRVDKAQIAFNNAKADYDRNKKLLDQGVIAEANFLPIDLAYKNAKAEVSAAQDNLDIIKEGVSAKSSSSSNTLVKSAVKGTVLDVPVKVGTSVIQANNFNDGTTIATVADMSDLIFDGKVDESEVGKLKVGMDLVLTIGAIPNTTFPAKLEYISPQGVSENGAIQFEIKAAVKQDQGKFIRAGYSANADIVLARRDSVLAINEGLLEYANDTPYVEIKTGPQQFKRQNVKLGLSDGINVQILDGLSLKDQIKIWNKPQSQGNF